MHKVALLVNSWLLTLLLPYVQTQNAALQMNETVHGRRDIAVTSTNATNSILLLGPGLIWRVIRLGCTEAVREMGTARMSSMVAFSRPASEAGTLIWQCGG